MANTTAAVDTETVLEDLVNQFSDPMSFLRELIQNAIDAGSGEVDIRVDFEPEGGGERGLMTAHIEDFGEGMSREIIETKLTRLFSSGKDEDYTKIGRFGIGFVSVFAIAPQIVCVDTGRGGEYWRVLFKQDRTFDLIALDHPVEGTQIRVFKQATRAEYERFVARAREVILYWCKHVVVPIYFEGDQLNQPFAIDSACQITHEEEGTRVIMGFVPEVQAPYGFYNRGLTLKEGEESDWAHVALKIDSRYLEHTLTRDQVLRDKNFHKAHRLLTKLAEERLPERLFAQLEELAARGHRGGDEHQALCELLHGWSTSWGDLRAQRRDRRPIILTLHGKPLSLSDCARRHKDGALHVTHARTHVCDALQEDYTILLAREQRREDAMVAVIEAYLEARVPAVEERWAMPAPAELDRAPGAQALKDHARALVRALGGKLEKIALGHFDYADGRSPLRRMMAVAHDELAAPFEVADIPTLGREVLLGTRGLALNADDERVARLVRVARDEPEWAAFTLVKMLLLHEGLRAEDDSLLVTHAIDRRERRLGKEARR